MANKKSGYLRRKCKGCGALVKEVTKDLSHTLNYGLSEAMKPIVHTGDEQRIGVLELIGGTYDEEGSPQ